MNEINPIDVLNGKGFEKPPKAKEPAKEETEETEQEQEESNSTDEE